MAFLLELASTLSRPERGIVSGTSKAFLLNAFTAVLRKFEFGSFWGNHKTWSWSSRNHLHPKKTPRIIVFRAAPECGIRFFAHKNGEIVKHKAGDF